MRGPGEIIGKEFQRNESMKASVLRLVDDAHSPASELLRNAVVGDGLADERGGVRHFPDMLGCGQRQVNEESWWRIAIWRRKCKCAAGLHSSMRILSEVNSRQLKVEGEGKKAFCRAPWKTCSVIRGRGNRQKPAPLKAKGAAPGPNEKWEKRDFSAQTADRQRLGAAPTAAPHPFLPPFPPLTASPTPTLP